jgi:hypothetical protein
MPITNVTVIRIFCVSLCAFMWATGAHAQGNSLEDAASHVGVGAGINFYSPREDGKRSQGIAFAYHWHTFHSGWGPTFGLDWHTTDFNQALGSVDAPLGSLRMRALLAGFGHTRRLGRFSASANVVGGYSFNDLSLDSAAAPAFARTGNSLLGVHVNNSAALKPEASVWYDVAKHAGVGVTAAYLVARPEEIVTSTAGTDVRHLRADAFELTVGVTFGVWKKR